MSESSTTTTTATSSSASLPSLPSISIPEIAPVVADGEVSPGQGKTSSGKKLLSRRSRARASSVATSSPRHVRKKDPREMTPPPKRLSGRETAASGKKKKFGRFFRSHRSDDQQVGEKHARDKEHIRSLAPQPAQRPSSHPNTIDEHKVKPKEPSINPKTGKVKKVYGGISKVEDLPSTIRSRIAENKIEHELVVEHLKSFLYICRFITRDSFRMENEQKLPHFPYVSPCTKEQQEVVESTLIPAPKGIKKFYKHLVPNGKGGYGAVFVAREIGNKDKKAQVALKKISHTSSHEIRHNLTEVHFLRTCVHKNIVRYHKSYLASQKKGNNSLYVVTEFLEGGTLSLASQSHTFSTDHVAYTAHQLLSAIDYLHTRHIAHRDLKSANVMMSITGDIKLIDFGLCADLTADSPDGKPQPRREMLGSPYWIPPEMIKREPHTCQVDIWSFAVCILELWLGKVPYAHSRLDCMFRAATGRYSNILSEAPAKETLTDVGKDFLGLCLRVDPSERPTSKELLAHEFVADGEAKRAGIDSILRSVFINRTLNLAGI